MSMTGADDMAFDTQDSQSVADAHPVDPTADPQSLCPQCGRTIAAHHSSIGYAARAPKTLTCPACGQKAHQNIDLQVARFECLYRQYAQATGKATVTTTTAGVTRIKLPPLGAKTLIDMAAWIGECQTAGADLDSQTTHTTANAQRAAARAASAPAQPMTSEVTSEPDPEPAPEPEPAAALSLSVEQALTVPADPLDIALDNFLSTDPRDRTDAEIDTLAAELEAAEQAAYSDPDSMVLSTVPLSDLAW